MRKDLRLIAVTALVLTASACAGPPAAEMTATPIEAAVPTVTLMPIATNVPAPTNAPAATNTPTPTDTPRPTNTQQLTAEGRIRGVLVDPSTKQGIQGIELCLFSYDPETHMSGGPLMPSVTTDAQGTFLFDHIPPGYYFLFSMTWKTSWNADQFGELRSFEAKPGETTDLGQIEVSH